jgi:hypothetical protein
VRGVVVGWGCVVVVGEISGDDREGGLEASTQSALVRGVLGLRGELLDLEGVVDRDVRDGRRGRGAG